MGAKQNGIAATAVHVAVDLANGASLRLTVLRGVAMTVWRSVSGPRLARFWRRSKGWVAVFGAVLAAVALTGAVAPGASAAQRVKIWSPFPAPATKSVSGHPLASGSRQLTVREPAGIAPEKYRPTASAWPAAGSAVAYLDGPTPSGTADAGVAPSLSGHAGTLPVWVSTVTTARSAELKDASPAPAEVRVAMASHKQGVAAGVSGVVMSLARADGVHAAGSVAVRLDYGSFADEYGGGWASRLRLVELPACALTTPGLARCRTQTPLTGTNEAASQELTATVPVAASGGTVVAAASTAAGAEGNYAATSLKPSGTWVVQGGDFHYSYPVTVPSSVGGSAPDVALSYDSQSIDGETSGTNTQSSWIGDGWDYSPGFIERSYEPCSQDGISKSGDECWGGYNATISLNGQSSVIVRDDVTGTWHLQGDDGSSVEELDGASNGLWNGEYWLVTTTNGTKYYFGLDHLPNGKGTDASTNSAWGVPVYNPDSGNPCYSSSSGASSECDMGYRWNLDYVVDPTGNLTVYNYATETNYYAMGGGQGAGTLTQYVRAGYPTSISYGYQLSDAINGAKPSAQVLFGTSQRCLTSSTFTNCAYPNLSSSTASNWPDVPYDENCAAGSTCTVDSPTFWSTVRLTSITTQVLEGSSFKEADSYALTQSFPDASGASNPVMYLDSIQRTGEDGTAITLPAETFTPTEIDNRVDGLTPAAPPLYRPRISVIDTEYGSAISITYAAPACSRVNGTMPSAPDTNTMPCFPVYWTPAGEDSPIQDWFNKSLVTQVSTADETGAGSPAQVTNYQYLGGAAWHEDDSPLTDSTYRTWDQFRGYAKVETTTGASPDPVTETVDTYMRGMDGDGTVSGGTTSASVTNSLGDSITDSDWLAGQVLETDTYTASGGSVDQKTINGPWTYKTTASQAQPGSLPTLTAELPQMAETRSLALLASGSWRTTQTDTSYNSDGLADQVDAKGDGTASDPEVCATSSYATSSAKPMMESYPSEVIAVAGPCGTTPTAANTVSDTRTYYDGAGNGSLTSMGTLGSITGGGQVTGTQVISGYSSSGTAEFQAKSAATYDEYGRTLESADANDNVTRTAYSPATGALPTQTVATNPMGWSTTTTLDPARDLPLTVTDPNGNVTTETYDSLGRATAVWLPGEPTSDAANETFSYSVSGTAPSHVTTDTLRGNGSYASDVKIYDGMLQLREEQQTPANGAAGRNISDNFYDSHGWTVKTSSTYYSDSSSPDGTLFVADDDTVPSQTVTDYDGQGRAISSKVYSLGQYQWQTATSYPGMDETDATPPSGGTATSTFTNALGETTATWSYSDSATPTDKASDAKVIGYTYTPGGQVATITDNVGNKWTYKYNLLGDKVSQTDPDSGTTAYAYDADANLTSSTDARGKTLVYAYDALNRKTAEYSGSVSTANELASWTYDTLAKGQITSSTSYADGSAYTEAVTGYNDAYQPTGTSLTIPASEGALAGTYTTASAYSPVTGDALSTAYSADGGLPAETVTYSYDPEGLLSAFGGNTAYLDATSYSPLGQVLRTTSGLYGSQLAVTSAYDAGTGRLLQSIDDVQTGSSAVDTTNYTYDDAGNITSISDAQDAGSTDTQCFTYNDLDQLTTAWTDAAGTTTARGTSVEGIGGCNTTTPSASTIGGPSPYWESWTYDPIGDRASETVDNTSGDTADDVTQTLTYPGSNGTSASSTPDSASAVATTGPGGTTTTDYDYNAAGDTTSRTSSATGDSPPAGPDQTFSYNPEDEVDSVTTDSDGTTQTSSYLYDADGNLLIQRDPGTTTLYLDNGAEELQLNTATGTVSGTRYYSEPDGTTIVRSSSGALNYELANQQNTNTETINASTLAVTRRYFDPYGNPRGSVPSSWVDNRGFLNQPADATTGLDLLGARQYDPVTGRFLSVDPILEAGDSYAADDPVNGSDPSGAMIGIPGGGGCMPLACEGGGSKPPPPPPGNNGNNGNNNNNNNNNNNGNNGNASDASNNGGGCWEPGGEYTCDVVPAPAPIFTAPKATAVALDVASPYACGRFGLGCNSSPYTWTPSGSGVTGLLRKAASATGNVTGVTAVVQCAEHPTLGGCFKAAAQVGLTALTVASGGTGSVLEAGADGAMDVTADLAADGADATAEAGGDGAVGTSAGDDSALSCDANSFTGQTPVLLASGKTLPIDRIAVGAEVLATDPYTGTTKGRQVTNVIVHSGTHIMVAVTLAGGGTLDTTDHHPFWDASSGQFVYADALHRGDKLRESNGRDIRVAGIRIFTADVRAYNLTISGIHTYYVLAGTVSVLVHNSCGTGESAFPDPDLGMGPDSGPDINGVTNFPDLGISVKGLPPRAFDAWAPENEAVVGPPLEPPNTYLPSNLGGPKWKKVLFLGQRLEGQDIGG
jgi:RHS repeat-associated protein